MNSDLSHSMPERDVVSHYPRPNAECPAQHFTREAGKANHKPTSNKNLNESTPLQAIMTTLLGNDILVGFSCRNHRQHVLCVRNHDVEEINFL